MPPNLEEGLVWLLLSPVHISDVLIRPDVHHGLPDKWILSFRTFKVVTTYLLFKVTISEKINSWLSKQYFKSINPPLKVSDMYTLLDS